MQRFLILFLVCASCVSGTVVELYETWNSEATGDVHFADAAGGQGYSVRRWDRKPTYPFLGRGRASLRGRSFAIGF